MWQAQLVQVIQLAGCNADTLVRAEAGAVAAECARTGAVRYVSDVARVSREHAGVYALDHVDYGGQLKRAKLIEYTRGVIHILDAKGLEKTACECYAVVEDYLDSYAQFDGGLPGQPPRSGIAS